MQAGRYLCNYVTMHLWANFDEIGWWACLNININLMVMMVTNIWGTNLEASLALHLSKWVTHVWTQNWDLKPKRSNKACNSKATRSFSSGNQKSNSSLEVMHLQVVLKSGDIWPFDSKKWHIQSLVIYQSSLVCCTNGLTWKNFFCPKIWFPVLPETSHFLFPYLILHRHCPSIAK